MGLFNFVVDITSAAVKVALTPVAIVADVAINVIAGENPELTEGAIRSAKQDLDNAVDDILP